MFLLAQDQMDQKAVMGDGLDFNLPITFGCLWAIFCADLVQDLEYQVRPYEVEAGRTDAVVRESMDYLFEVFKNRPRQGLLARHHLAPRHALLRPRAPRGSPEVRHDRGRTGSA